MGAYVVIAEFAVPSGHMQEFLELCRYDSERSVTDEAGCRQFDVVTPAEATDAVVLYEVYDSKAAFDIHMTTPHYDVFATGVERLGVTVTQVRFFERVHPKG
jgi:quinol monooxygenase YgiN